MLHLFWRCRQAAQDFLRKRRFALIRQELPVPGPDAWIVDLGGGPASFYSRLTSPGARVILLDIAIDVVRQARTVVPGLTCVVARGEALPFVDGAIDLTICNSVIEHVPDPGALAVEIRRTSRRYFIQTPSARFPVEMHSPYPIPAYRWLPGRRLRRWVAARWGADPDYLESVRYLSRRDLARLFPGARLHRERVCGLTKSFYVIAP